MRIRISHTFTGTNDDCREPNQQRHRRKEAKHWFKSALSRAIHFLPSNLDTLKGIPFVVNCRQQKTNHNMAATLTSLIYYTATRLIPQQFSLVCQKAKNCPQINEILVNAGQIKKDSAFHSRFTPQLDVFRRLIPKRINPPTTTKKE